MATIYDLIVVIPVGPNETLEDLFDTIESVLYYTTRERRIILVDDSGKDTCIAVQAQIPDIDVVKTPHNNGDNGGLYLTLSLGYLHAHRNYTFKVLLKLDVDALVITTLSSSERRVPTKAVEHMQQPRRVDHIEQAHDFADPPAYHRQGGPRPGGGAPAFQL